MNIPKGQIRTTVSSKFRIAGNKEIIRRECSTEDFVDSVDEIQNAVANIVNAVYDFGVIRLLAEEEMKEE